MSSPKTNCGAGDMRPQHAHSRQNVEELLHSTPDVLEKGNSFKRWMSITYCYTATRRKNTQHVKQANYFQPRVFRASVPISREVPLARLGPMGERGVRGARRNIPLGETRRALPPHPGEITSHSRFRNTYMHLYTAPTKRGRKWWLHVKTLASYPNVRPSLIQQP